VCARVCFVCVCGCLFASGLIVWCGVCVVFVGGVYLRCVCDVFVVCV